MILAVERGITLKEPWASCIAASGTVRLPVVGKMVENRTWPTKHTGPLAIVAGNNWDADGASLPLVRALLRKHTDAEMRDFQRSRRRGAVVAVANVAGCHRSVGCCAPWGQPSGLGRDVFHFVFDEVVTLVFPIAVKGFQTIRPLPLAAREQVNDQLADLARAA